MNKIIELKDLSFGYKSDLLSNVNLSINEGEFVGITGDNGEGKTTLLKLILGQLKPNQGDIILAKDSDGKKLPLDI